MPSDAGWGLVLPFLTDDPEFAKGVEVGMLYERMKHEDAVEGDFLLANQEQILLLANRLGWYVESCDATGDDFRLVMRRSQT
jgi:hypothetical protein